MTQEVTDLAPEATEPADAARARPHLADQLTFSDDAVQGAEASHQRIPMTWRHARALIGSDLDRLAWHLRVDSRGHRLFWCLTPTFHALMCYRITRYAYLRGWRGLARLTALWSLWTTRIELSPTASIGPGCLIAHGGSVFFGRAGARLTLQGTCGCGHGIGEQDIGGGPGYPVLGDDVVLAQLCAVLGAIRIGDGARVGPGAVVTRDVPAGGVAVGPRCRIMRTDIAGASGAEMEAAT